MCFANVQTHDTCTDARHDGFCAVELDVEFHTEWMNRAPDREMLNKAVVRRHSFPVAIVVVVHDDISLMRAALENVAVVVEHIVSERGYVQTSREGIHLLC